MSESHLTRRAWVVDLVPDESRMRCSYQRRGRRIARYIVQLEIWYTEKWVPIVRYDNAHGFCHRDTLHPNGTQDKTPVHFGETNATFTHAIQELSESWEAHRARFLREAQT